MGTQNQTNLWEEEEDEAWLRRLTQSEEYLRRFHPSLRGGYYRWFESANVVDLVHYRRQREREGQGRDGP
jgi:hypothetical protein